jgi:hypothetical protein
MKEVGLLLGRLAQLLPLAPPTHLLSCFDLHTLGTFLTHALSTIKHNGANEKLHLGFGSLCRSLLLQQQPELSSLPATWLRKLLEALTRRDQTRTNITRRSAGLPLAFLAAFMAEPPGSTKRLMPAATKELLAIAGGPECAASPQATSTADGTKQLLATAGSGPECAAAAMPAVASTANDTVACQVVEALAKQLELTGAGPLANLNCAPHSSCSLS